MDFAAPEPVVHALRERVDHGVYGYCSPPVALREAVQERLARLYNWRVELDAIFFLGGVVSGFNLACHAVGEAGDEILVEPPVYPPLLRAPANAQRTCTRVQLVEGSRRYERDIDAFEAAVSDRTSLFLLCNPHNPVSRAFERSELEQVAEVCLRHNVVICSDEIHCDILFDGNEHIPIAALAPEVAAQTITLVAPSKTYNIAGLHCALGVVQNPDLRARLERVRADLVPGPGVLALTAAFAAYREGQEWLDALLVYLEDNRDLVVERIAALSGMRCWPVEATFLAWLDCRQSAIEGNPHRFFLDHARVALNDGSTFGPGGAGYVRLNFGCQRSVLVEALDRMEQSLAAL
jgi:cystathionine beta-lyase